MFFLNIECHKDEKLQRHSEDTTKPCE